MVTVAILLLVASVGTVIGVGVSSLCHSCKKDEYFTSEEVKTSKYIKELKEIVEKIDNLSKLLDIVDVDLREHIHKEEGSDIEVNNRLELLKLQYDNLNKQESFRHDMVLDKLECIAKIIVNTNDLDSQKQNKVNMLLAKGVDGIYDELENLSLELGENKSAICRKINELKPHMKKKRKRR